MTDGKKQAKGPAKTIRVSTDMHAKFRAYQHRVHADSAEEAMALLLGDNVLRIPMPEAVMQRWEAEAKASGFPLYQWVAQRVEAWLANRAHAGEVRAALNELLGLKRSLQAGAQVHDIYRGVLPAPAGSEEPQGPSKRPPVKRPPLERP